jgi:hypothetical protein
LSLNTGEVSIVFSSACYIAIYVMNLPIIIVYVWNLPIFTVYVFSTFRMNQMKPTNEIQTANQLCSEYLLI